LRFLVGTSGYAYKEWKGTFYPEKLPQAQMLHYYGERFGSVEINNTFYRMPKAEVMRNWAAQVPDGFLFSVKATRRITHNKRLRDAGDELMFLCEQSLALGDKLGPLLFQLPPNMKKDADRLRTFLGHVPEGQRVAFEFRNETWCDDEVYTALRNANAALVVADAETMERGSVQITPTADWGYMRLRRCDYSDDELADWKQRIAGQDWTDAYTYFKHEEEGTGPDLARRFEDA